MGGHKFRGEAMQVRTPGGVVGVRWDKRSTATATGQLAVFAEYLEATGLFEGWLRTSPLKYSSPNAPALVAVLGTRMRQHLRRSVDAALYMPWARMPHSSEASNPSFTSCGRSAPALASVSRCVKWRAQVGGAAPGNLNRCGSTAGGACPLQAGLPACNCDQTQS